MIVYVIIHTGVIHEMVSGPDYNKEMTGDIREAIKFTNKYEAWEFADFLGEETRRTFTVETRKIVEVENTNKVIISGSIIVGDYICIIGVEKKEYDMELLRGGDGC